MCRPSALGAHTSRKLVAAIAFALLATASSAFGQSTQGAPYRDASRPVAERVRDLLGRMTLEEKFWQLFMIPGDLDDPANDYSHGVFGLQVSPARDTVDPARAHAKRINAIQRYFVERTRLGIPIIPFEEAVHGLVRPGATSFPQAIGLAATWDTSLMSRVAAAIAEETRSRGIRQVLSPVVNIANDPRWGRVEETYGEDPVLSSRMAVAFVSAFERAGVVATPKHFVANVGDGGRDSYPIDFDARLLDELYFPPFMAAIKDGHARSVMSAYNSVERLAGDAESRAAHGQAAPRLGVSRIRHLRRGGHGRRDGAAPHRSEHGDRDDRRARGGTRRDLPELVAAASAVSRRVPARADRRFRDRRRRGARAAREVRARAVRASVRGRRQREADWNGNAEHRALALEAARESIVLLKNDGGALPLAKTMSLDRRDRHRRGRGAARRLQRARKSQDLDSRRHHRRVAQRAPDGVVRYAPGPGRLAREYRRRASRRTRRPPTAAARCAACTASTSTTIASTARRDSSRGPTRASTSAGRSTRPGAAFRSTGIRCAGPARSRFRRAACSASASRGTTAIAVSRRQARDRRLAEAIVRLATGERAARAGQHARPSARVLREHRQCAREARVGRRRSRRLARDDRLGGVGGARESTSPSSSRDSRRASFAIARCSRCPVIRKS